MKIEVRFAGYYRSLSGQPSIQLELPEGVTVENALVKLDEVLEGRCHDIFFPDDPEGSHPLFLIVVGTHIVDRETSLQNGDVMAIVPPMAGG